MKKLLIIALFLFSATTTYGAWETTGNVVQPTDFIGATNTNAVLKFKIAGQEIYRIQPDGMRFMKPITTITNDNGQFVLNHVTATGCTGIFGNIDKILNICSDGFTFSGGPIHFKTKYYNYTENGSYTLTSTDHTVESNGGEVIVPLATLSNKGKRYEIINVSEASLPIRTTNGQLIGNYNAESEYQLPLGGAVTLISNGTGWRVTK